SAMRTMLYGAAHLRRFRGPGIYHGACVQEIRTSLRPAAHARTVGTGLRRRPRRRLAGAAAIGSFVAVVALFAVLLMLPASMRHPGSVDEVTHIANSVFVAVSAVCV